MPVKEWWTPAVSDTQEHEKKGINISRHTQRLNLDDGKDYDGDDGDRATKPPVSIAPSDWITSTSENGLLSDFLFYYNLISERIFTNDRAYLEQCKGVLIGRLPRIHPVLFLLSSFCSQSCRFPLLQYEWLRLSVPGYGVYDEEDSFCAKWTRCELHKLRERVAAKASLVALSELSSEDLQSVRILLSNCQYCVNEAEKTLGDESTKSTVSISVPKVPELASKVEERGKLLPLDFEQPPGEDECLEAIVEAEDLQAGGEESLYDDLDYLGQPVGKAENCEWGPVLELLQYCRCLSRRLQQHYGGDGFTNFNVQLEEGRNYDL
ncbi:hypothetical protein EGR_05405 [Echinococcus granulosus]|uniref:Uncharacterized protein n=1 Tax=Echinococcus granulosus TaxID=6210 RepID=W6UEC0_ECHGR|nr:hypothetical protein EGR_05405 [Echinococcus granulosus]EUB59785.1 hypothetical protein EGR_05405 [Echinococcus granulosus]